MSAVEVITNTALGFAIGLLTNLLVLPLFGYNVTISQSTIMAMIFTMLSIVRGYIIRRIFNKI